MLLIELTFFSIVGTFHEKLEATDLDNIIVSFAEKTEAGMCFDELPSDLKIDLTWYRTFPKVGRTNYLVIENHGRFGLVDIRMSVLQNLRDFGGAVYDGQSLEMLQASVFLERLVRVLAIAALYLLLLLGTTRAVRELIVTLKMALSNAHSEALSSPIYRKLLCYSCIQGYLMSHAVRPTQQLAIIQIAIAWAMHWKCPEALVFGGLLFVNEAFFQI